jgi:hypothetical protein
MSRWKSQFNEKNGNLERVPVDLAAHLEVLELDFREGRIKSDEYAKKKAEIEKLFSDAKEADKKAEASRVSTQVKEREAVAKAQAEKKKIARAAAVARSAEKAKRKGGK